VVTAVRAGRKVGRAEHKEHRENKRGDMPASGGVILGEEDAGFFRKQGGQGQRGSGGGARRTSAGTASGGKGTPRMSGGGKKEGGCSLKGGLGEK